MPVGGADLAEGGAAAVAGGMAATFNAPLASILLTVELLLFEWRPWSLVPVSAAVVVSTVCRGVMLGVDPVFAVAAPAFAPGPAFDALALVPGLTGGLLAIGATALVYFAADLFARLPGHWMWWPALGGLVIGVGGLIEPPGAAAAVVTAAARAAASSPRRRSSPAPGCAS